LGIMRPHELPQRYALSNTRHSLAPFLIQGLIDCQNFLLTKVDFKRQLTNYIFVERIFLVYQRGRYNTHLPHPTNAILIISKMPILVYGNTDIYKQDAGSSWAGSRDASGNWAEQIDRRFAFGQAGYAAC